MFVSKIIALMAFSLMFVHLSAFKLPDKCGQFNLTNVLQGKIRIVDLGIGAVFFQAFFNENTKEASEYPMLNNFVNKFLEVGFTKDAAVKAALMYLGAVALTSYCYIEDAKKKLKEARWLDDKFRLSLDYEVKPLLDEIENSLKNPHHVCQHKNDVIKMLTDRIIRVQNIQKEIKDLENECSERQEQTKILTWVLGAISGIIAFLCFVMEIILVVLVVLNWHDESSRESSMTLQEMAYFILILCVVGSPFIGFIYSHESNLTYKQALNLLKDTNSQALNAAKTLTMYRTKVEMECVFGFYIDSD